MGDRLQHWILFYCLQYGTCICHKGRVQKVSQSCRTIMIGWWKMNRATWTPWARFIPQRINLLKTRFLVYYSVLKTFDSIAIFFAVNFKYTLNSYFLIQNFEMIIKHSNQIEQASRGRIHRPKSGDNHHNFHPTN